MDEILAHEAALGIKIPNALKEILTVSNELTIDGCGLMHFYRLENCSLHGTGEGAYIPKYLTIGSVIGVKGGSIYADLTTGIISVKADTSVYVPVGDFCNDILVPYENRLRKHLAALERKDELLEKQRDNPFREYYDTLVGYNENAFGKGKHYPPAILYPPASEEEISAWEQENNIVLPESYKNWILLSNGTGFNGWGVDSLDEVKNNLTDGTMEFDEGTYVLLASLTGGCDYLLGNIRTSEALELSEEYETSVGDDSLIDHLTYQMEWYEEQLEEENE